MSVGIKIKFTCNAENMVNTVKTIMFVKFCCASACYLDLNLTCEELISLCKECLKLAEYYSDVRTMIDSGFKLVILSSEMTKFTDSLLYLKEILPLVETYGDDVEVLALYVGLSETLKTLKEYNEAIVFAKKWVGIAKKISSREQEMKAYSFIGEAYLSLGYYDDAIEYSTKMLDIAKELDDSVAQIKGYLLLMMGYSQIRRFSVVICYGKKCLNTAKSIDNERNEVEILLLMGTAYLELSQSNEAIFYWTRCLSVAKKCGYKYAEMNVCSFLAGAYLSLNQYENAIVYDQMFIDLDKGMNGKMSPVDVTSAHLSTKTVSDKAYAYSILGRSYSMLGQYDDAVSCCKKSINIPSEGHQKRISDVIAYQTLGKVMTSLKIYDAAASYYEKCLKIAQDAFNKEVEVETYLIMAGITLLMKQDDNAISYSEKCIALARLLGYKHIEIKAYHCLGEAFYSKHQYPDAITYSKKCIDLVKETRGKCGKERKSDKRRNDNLIAVEDAVYVILVKAYRSLKQYKDAILCGEKILDLAQESGNKRNEMQAFLGLVETNGLMKQYENGILYGKKCLDIAKDTGDKHYEMVSYLSLGDTCHLLKHYDDAILYGRRCLDMANEAGDKKTEMDACLLLGHVYVSLNQCVDASGYGKKWLEIAKEVGDKENEMKAHAFLAEVFVVSCQLSSCLMHITEGMNIAKEMKDDKAEERFKSCLHDFYSIVGMREQAVSCCELPINDFKNIAEGLVKDLEEATNTNDKRKANFSLIRLYRYHRSKDQFQQAIECLQQLSQLESSIYVKQYCHLELGVSYLAINQDENALRHYRQSLTYAKDSGNKMYQSVLLFHIALEVAKTDLNLAEKHLKESLSCFEIIFASLHGLDIFKISIVDPHFEQCSKFLSLLLVKTHRVREAISVLDGCRARALNDVMATAFVSSQEVAGTESTHGCTSLDNFISNKTFSILFYSVHDIFQCVLTFVINESGKRLYFSSKIFDDADGVVDKAFDELEVCHVVNCEDRSLDLEVSVNNTHNLDDLDKQVPRPQQVINKIHDRLFNDPDSSKGTSKCDNEGDANALVFLYRMLIEDAKCYLKEDEIVIIADGPLHRVPFAALRDPGTGRYLSETKRIRLAPSIATLKLLNDCPVDYHCKSGALVIGDPFVGRVMLNGVERDISGLESAHAEAIVIAHNLGVKPLTGPEATKAAVIEKLQQGVSIVHIAAHGSLTKGTIALTPSPEIRATKIPDEEDYMLTMADVQQAQVRAQLVVLSCCYSGRGEIRAEGVVGMCRAFLASGARAVVASLWAIDDDATLEFMTRFYRNLRDGKSASVSLQQAMNEMRTSTKYKKPKYWAPFFLIGDDVTIQF